MPCGTLCYAIRANPHSVFPLVSDAWVHVEVVIVEETSTVAIIPWEGLSSNVHVWVCLVRNLVWVTGREGIDANTKAANNHCV